MVGRLSFPTVGGVRRWHSNEPDYFKKILIANRGEIACRVIRTARKCGIRTVSVFSDADANAMHVEMADEAHHIGGAKPQDSYLCYDRILDTAKKTGAQAIHPGYGFLSENAEFANACEDAGVVFIGPPADAMRSMASKSAAKSIMTDAGVPVVPGYHGEEQSVEFLADQAEKIGYPVLIKAVLGGGGKGMRIVDDRKGLEEAVQLAQREAQASFGDARILVEKYIRKPRHIEVQVFSDTHGGHVYLWDRDCSVQRRYQKIIEEAPAPGLAPEIKASMGEAATNCARAVNYVGAGTVEFILDRDTDEFYFMEMNTRLQVEHPVSEMVTGQDFVEWQLKIAAGAPLPLQQNEIPQHGHSFEARIYAENPRKDFMPGSGHISFMRTPEPHHPYVRVDTGIREGDDVTVFYDPMIAKLITWDADRPRALQQLRTALDQFQISGLSTNIDFLKTLSSHQAFIDLDLDTGFIPRYRDELFPEVTGTDAKVFAIGAMVAELDSREGRGDLEDADPWSLIQNLRLNHSKSQTYEFLDKEADDELVRVELTFPAGKGCRAVVTRDSGAEHIYEGIDAEIMEDPNQMRYSLDGAKEECRFFRDGNDIDVFLQDSRTSVSLKPLDLGVGAEADAGLVAPVTGQITKTLVKAGDTVEKGQQLVVMSAMKMEYIIRSNVDGTIGAVFHKEGDIANEQEVLVRIDQGE
eukprot:CAMPEP_0119136744 /NCGR_PEP_ID=MMETSP1310-20130426/22020_1 /TAXON_ID=464262 /ORGANISM="Genus nov. species nov., Strain RCC2339" /LENGTH=694 /DNA_ID=CAMNT_0007127767 /DNA_START=13 /DNA_END=2097 /DNA_ORIENTATION=-